ncbi:MAG: PTS sugar transporter subunit IIA [Pirellulales bacterium]
MSHVDFDVESLSRHLRMDAAQVARLAERGKLPGRRIGGQWRFAMADIHHWWEERISGGTGAELATYESVLQSATDPANEPLLSIGDILPLEAIAVPLAARTRTSVITSVVELAVGTGLLWDGDKMEEAVRAREEISPTALDNGVALLHPRRPQSSILAQPLLALARTNQALPFGHPRGVMTDIFFLLCSIDDASHLWVLARLSRLMAVPGLLAELRSVDDSRSARELLLNAEAELAVSSS